MIEILYKFNPYEKTIYILCPVYIMCLMNHWCLSTFARGPLQQYACSREKKTRGKEEGNNGSRCENDERWLVGDSVSMPMSVTPTIYIALMNFSLLQLRTYGE
jgi:hypothetical protein